MTTKDIIKTLPFEDAFKRDLLGKFDELSPDARYSVERILWDLYDAIYTMKLQGRIEAALDPDHPSPVPLNSEFYKTIKSKLDEDLSRESVQVAEQVDLVATREKLQEMLDKPDN